MTTERTRLLIVEDDADLAENLAEILEGVGYDTAVACSAEHALELLDGETFAGVITDFRLPGLGGVDLIAALRERGVPVPVAVISGFIDPQIAERAEEAGALDVLPKPVDLKRLFELVTTFTSPRGEVLIVEDNEALAENLAEALESSGLQTAIGSSAESALSRRSLPKVALVDLRLPDRNGIEVARRLRARDPKIKIIFVTAYGSTLRHAEGDLPLVAKPFDVAELVERVCAAVAERE